MYLLKLVKSKLNSGVLNVYKFILYKDTATYSKGQNLQIITLRGKGFS